MKKLPTIFVCPHSIEIIKSVTELKNVGLTATRHQVSENGYVCDDISLLNSKVICERDHGGDDLQSYLDDCKLGYPILHLDTWTTPHLSVNVSKTINIIKKCHNEYPDVKFEIGTEEKVFPYTPYILEIILDLLKNTLIKSEFDAILYVVIQGGAKVFNCSNIYFNEDQFVKMVNICKRYGKLSKEHNCDFLGKNDLEKRIELGLDAYNIGPEIVYNQNKIIYNSLDSNERKEIFNYCKSKNEWQRWTDKEELIPYTVLHYYYKYFNFNTVDITNIIKEIIVI